jgi:hypothetical protein
MVTPEPSLSGRRDPEPLDMWQCWSPPNQGDGIQSYYTRGDIGALPMREAGSGATGHVATSGPSLSRRRDPKALDTWQPRDHLGWETGSGATGHVATRGCTPHSLS